MRCELCGKPGPVQEFGLADGEVALCAVCYVKSTKGYQDFAERDQADERHRSAGS